MKELKKTYEFRIINIGSSDWNRNLISSGREGYRIVACTETRIFLEREVLVVKEKP